MTEDTQADANTQETPGAAASLSAERKDYIRKTFRRHSGAAHAVSPGPLADIGGVWQVLLDHAASGTAVAPETASMLAGSLFGALAIIRPQLRAWEETHAEAVEQMALMDARVPPVRTAVTPARHAQRVQGKM